MRHILPVREGSNVSLVDLVYYDGFKYKNRPEYQNRYEDDVLYIVYKDDKGEKKIEMKEKPEAEIYFTKPECRGEWSTPREYVPIDKVYSEKIRYKKILPRIFEELKQCNDERSSILRNTYIKAMETGNYTARKEIYKSQHAFMSDLPIEDYYRIMLWNYYNTDIAHNINKAFMDIEADIYKMTSAETKQNKDKINAVTLIFNFDIEKRGMHNRFVCTFLLRDHERYPQQEEFEKNIGKFIDQCHEEFDEIKIVNNGKEKTIKTDAGYRILMYDSEVEMLEAVFKLINTAKPDTMAIWNIAYDLPKIYNRLLMNKKNPVDIMSDPMFPKQARMVDMHIDDRSEVEMFNRKTYIKMTSTVKYLCQMILYASIRKGMKNYGSNELDNIAYRELKITKRRFKKGITIHNAAIKDYWNFVLYSINDVWVQALIEEVTNDITTIFFDSNSSATSIENISKQTIYLRNVYYSDRFKEGFVSANNVNNDYLRGYMDANADYVKELSDMYKKRHPEDEEADEDLIEEEDLEFSDELEEQMAEMANNIYEDSVDAKIILTGGLVGNPNLKSANGEELVRGVKSKHVFQHAMDMDYKAEYPYAKYTRNISKSTQYGRLIIPKKISNRQNEHGNKLYIPGAEFISDYISQDFISMGNVWFNLKTADELIKEFKEKR